MRYIGNKTRLLSFIGDFLRRRGINSGRALDAFAGTATVANYLKAKGFSVAACDIMTYSYVFQRAYVVANAYPEFAGVRDDAGLAAARRDPIFAAHVKSRLAGDDELEGGGGGGGGASGAEQTVRAPRPRAARPLAEVLTYLNHWLAPHPSFITQHYSAPDEPTNGERMYFTQDTAARIDAIREQVERWRSAGQLTDDEYYILLAALIEAADAQANTTGQYAAFLKRWQANTRRPFRLPFPPLVASTTAGACEAHHGDINTIVSSLGHFDLLYLDPPYNNRQYNGYYHIPEILARGWFNGDVILRGKTGLLGDDAQSSAWSTKTQCLGAFEDLIERADADHVVMSYNNEGIIPQREIERVFRAHGVEGTYRRVARRHFRYRSDRDGAQRQYSADRVTEYLYYVCLRRRVRRRPGGAMSAVGVGVNGALTDVV